MDCDIVPSRKRVYDFSNFFNERCIHSEIWLQSHEIYVFFTKNNKRRALFPVKQFSKTSKTHRLLENTFENT